MTQVVHAAPVAAIDHLVYFVPDLEIGIDDAERRFGTRPEFGGRHPGRGTHNALVGLGDCYLELIAPDPTQPDPPTPRPFGIDERTDAGYVAFAVRPGPTDTIDGLVDAMRGAGVDPGDPAAMSRATPDGSELHWRLTLPLARYGGAVPFLIDWGSTTMPHTTAPAGPRLDSLSVTTEHPAEVAAVVAALGLGDRVHVEQGPFCLAPVLAPTE